MRATTSAKTDIAGAISAKFGDGFPRQQFVITQRTFFWGWGFRGKFFVVFTHDFTVLVLKRRVQEALQSDTMCNEMIFQTKKVGGVPPTSDFTGFCLGETKLGGLLLQQRFPFHHDRDSKKTRTRLFSFSVSLHGSSTMPEQMFCKIRMIPFWSNWSRRYGPSPAMFPGGRKNDVSKIRPVARDVPWGARDVPWGGFLRAGRWEKSPPGSSFL